ncbi:MAG: anthranilate phosphoribosyltransferase [Nitrospirae bacterium]|nr:anthranilate phosphoribosyltransferase [Nitrospirota bacterium]
MIKEAISILIEKIDLSEKEMSDTMREIMEGKATDAQIGAFLTALRLKGETISEITGAAKVMREKALSIKAPTGTVDTCGTGGDMAHTFNISTTAAIVVAGAGIPVAKHGNRSVSSKSGSADLLQSLGVNIELPLEKIEKSLIEVGFGFLFAPVFHGAMKYALEPRREIGIRTVFNILGPLTNPAGAKYQVLGVYSSDLTETMAKVLGNLGCIHAFVVHGEDGLDEITITGKTKVSELKGGKVENYFIEPADFGIKPGSIEDLLGGEAKENAEITINILEGEKGPKRDIVLLNASAAIVASGKAKDLKEGIAIAERSIDSGAALRKLEEIKNVTSG